MEQHDEGDEEEAEDEHSRRADLEAWRIVGVEAKNAIAAATAA